MHCKHSSVCVITSNGSNDVSLILTNYHVNVNKVITNVDKIITNVDKIITNVT